MHVKVYNCWVSHVCEAFKNHPGEDVLLEEHWIHDAILRFKAQPSFYIHKLTVFSLL